MISAIGGTIWSTSVPKLPTGPAIIVILSILVLLSLIFAPNRGMLWQFRKNRQSKARIIVRNHKGSQIQGTAKYLRSRGRTTSHRRCPMTVHTEILLIAIAVSIACAIPGVFLVLRRMSMMADAITHTVFLGIVLAFFMTEDLNSPFLLVGATLVGVGTVWLTEMIHNKGLSTKMRLSASSSRFYSLSPSF